MPTWTKCWTSRLPLMYYIPFPTSLYMKLITTFLCFSLIVCHHVVHATASPQWLAGGSGHSVRRGPSHCDPLWARLGPNVHENGRGSVQYCWKGAICSLFDNISMVKLSANVNMCAVCVSQVKNFAVIYLVDITEVPDFNKMYELYDPCTVMFFFR